MRTAIASFKDLQEGISCRSFPAMFYIEIIFLVGWLSFAIKAAAVSTRNLCYRFLVLASSYRENIFVRRVDVLDRIILLMDSLLWLWG